VTLDEERFAALRARRGYPPGVWRSRASASLIRRFAARPLQGGSHLARSRVSANRCCSYRRSRLRWTAPRSTSAPRSSIPQTQMWQAPLATRTMPSLVAEAGPRPLRRSHAGRRQSSSVRRCSNALLISPLRPMTCASRVPPVPPLVPLLEERWLNDRPTGFKLGAPWSAVRPPPVRQPGHAGLEGHGGAHRRRSCRPSWTSPLAAMTSSAKAGLEGLVRRALVAPLDGYIEIANARAGDRVGGGRRAIAALEDSDLTLERFRAGAPSEQQRQIEYRSWLSATRATVRQIATSRSQICLTRLKRRSKLVDDQLSRLQLKAPFDALVTAGRASASRSAPSSAAAPRCSNWLRSCRRRVTLAVQPEVRSVTSELGQAGSPCSPLCRTNRVRASSSTRSPLSPRLAMAIRCSASRAS